MSAAATERNPNDRAADILRRAGNPFRNYFARNPDDEVCARYHVPELFAAERDLLLGVVDLYRYDPMMHSEVVPILGNKGAGKTHLLHSIKHGGDGAWQLLVTPGVYQRDSEFLEYLLFQIIDTLLSGGKQRGVRPLEYVGEELVRRLLARTLTDLPVSQRQELFPTPGLKKLTRFLGIGQSQMNERLQWLIDNLSGREGGLRPSLPVERALSEAGLSAEKAYELLCAQVERTEAHNTSGMMRRQLFQGFGRAVLLGDESTLAQFLTYGFAELEFQVRPTRQDLVLALFKVLTEVFRGLKIPIVVAFDQLEDLLLARRSDDAHRIAESFFAGIVQVMHQIDGLCFLIFAERGLWNRFVPSLDGYIQDRLNNPVHVPRHGTVKAVRLEAPPAELVKCVVAARMRPALTEVPSHVELNETYPFTDDQIQRIARTEPTLRDMLQQFRHLFDHIVFPNEDDKSMRVEPKNHPESEPIPAVETGKPDAIEPPPAEITDAGPSLRDPAEEPITPVNRLADTTLGPLDPPADGVGSRLGDDVTIKSVVTLDAPAAAPEPSAPDEAPDPLATEPVAPPTAAEPAPAPASPPPTAKISPVELWDQELRAARRRLEPEGALTGATRELQAGLGLFLQICHEHGVKVGPWRLHHVVSEWTFGDHPTYGVVSIAHWACKDGQPWKVGIGLFLGRGAGKPKDIEVKLSAFDSDPPVIDHLILLRPDDDLTLSGKSKTHWQDAERRGRHARLEAVSVDGFAAIYAFPRWIAAITESLPDGAPLPNLADLIQEKCEKILEQVCMPVQG
jgi:hypothetical protein